MLTISDLTFRIGGRTLLDNANLTVSTGQRIGLIGPNGTGKSTLFKLITGELVHDGGDIIIANRTSIGVVRQDIPEDDTSLVDIVLSFDKERADLLKEAETTEDPERIGYIYTRLEEIGAYEAPSRAETILAGLGFNNEAQQMPISAFSGGWRMRVALAAALFLQPDLLMLDEPTNHLDFEAMVWLENYLMNYEKTFIVISHDRDILNKTVTHIAHLENKKITMYTGSYDDFERRRAEKLMNQQALHEKQMAQKEHMMKFVDRFRATASKARQAQSRLKAIQKMDIVDAVMADRVTKFEFPEPEQLSSPIIMVDNVSVGYTPGKPILKNLSLRIDMDDRIALLGANGNGKSTLVKLISDTLQPEHGEMRRSSKLKIGYFAQHQTDDLDVTQTPYETMQDVMKGQPEHKVRGILGRFGFDHHKANTRVSELSGGEKGRLLLCIMSYDAPHIMLLDEPTNHLDMDAREALTQALNNYNGAVILVSHDPHLVECVADRLWLVADGGCHAYDGDIDAYRQHVMDQRKRERKEAREANKAGKEKKSSNDNEKDAKKLEKKIAELTRKRDDLENEIAVFAQEGAGHKLKDMNIEHSRLIKELQQAELDWMKLIA